MTGRTAAAVTALALAGCARPAAPPATEDPVRSEEVRTVEADVKNLQTAQEAYVARHGHYAAEVGALIALGFRASPGVRAEVVAATGDTFCLRATGLGVVRYLTPGGVPTATPCG